MQEPKSKNISQYGYREQDETLVIQFNHGNRYEYPGVPREVFDQMVESDSAGKFFAAKVKNDYPANRVEPKKQNAEA
jgi:hypothetical protein